MSQNTTDKKFPTQEALEIVDKINTKIDQILSNPDIGSESIYVLKSDIENIIKLLFNSVLEGEFVGNNNIESNVNILEKRISDIDILKIDNFIIESSPYTKETIEFITFQEIIESIPLITKMFSIYQLFIGEIKTLLKKDKDYIYTRSVDKKNFNREDYQLFLISLDLCTYDIQLSEKKDFASEIQYIIKLIETFSDKYSESKEKMLKKANFLLFKWQKRAEINKQNIIPIIDGKQVDDTFEKKVLSYGEDWRNIVEYINNHYLDNKNYYLKKSFCELNKPLFEKYTCRDIHLYIKYYKDIDRNLQKLDEIIDFLASKKSESDIFSINYAYAVNNRFSLFLEECSDKNKVYDEYQDVKKKVKKEDKNYFPQYKFIEKIILIINEKLSIEQISLEEIKDLDLFIKEKLEPEYKKYKVNMEWFSQHSNFIYRVVYQECMIDNIYVYSSFLLPTSNKEAYDKYEIISSDYQTLKTQIEPLKKISSLLSETKKINEEIKKRDVKTIELMGLFSAIIAFVMGSIPGFQFVRSIWSAILFLLVFSTGLISFLLVLILITRHNGGVFKEYRTKIIGFYTGILVLIVLFGWAVKHWEKNEKNNTEELKQHSTILIETKKDSINSFEEPNKSEIKKDSVLGNINKQK
ncbi:hypothetical protein CGC58_05885 [Capnocytophaga stomatis]|uniref:Uncharacterized protein n=1 Tax=Capnocytophaga stomatis TaxID=1848904 RepID=A0A250FW49_9FLAO|nr:hypothetical protein [Capnocytophaga stomatis]ATA89294.1 hypothetical protein CGC58_05885 [Capnocytophaga stomatis]